MTIFDIAGIARPAYDQAFKKANIESGFAVCGSEPFNRDIFTADDFLAASVTDRPAPEAPATEPDISQMINPQPAASGMNQ